jgi:hypothetical protein
LTRLFLAGCSPREAPHFSDVPRDFRDACLDRSRASLAILPGLEIRA